MCANQDQEDVQYDMEKPRVVVYKNTWRVDLKEEELGKDFNIAWLQTLPINSCTFEQCKDIQEKVLLILHCTTMCYRTKDLPSTSTTSEREWVEIDKKEDKQYFFTTVSPIENGYGMGETPRDLTKPRIAPSKNTWKRLRKFGTLVQFETRSEERIAILSITITRNRSLQHTASSWHWVSGTYENSGWAPPEGSLNSESATIRTEIELAILTTRSTRTRRKNILRPPKRIAEWTWCNIVDCRVPDIPHSAVEQQDTNRRDTVKKLIQQFESHPNKESFLQDLNQTVKVHTSSHRSPSSPSWCSPQSSTRGPGPTPCATSAWGPWPLLTTRHAHRRVRYCRRIQQEGKEEVRRRFAMVTQWLLFYSGKRRRRTKEKVPILLES